MSQSRFKSLQLELKLEGGFIKYNMLNGCMFIGEFGFENGKSLPAGVYEIALGKKLEKARHISHVATQHIAVNGSFDSLARAAEVMPEFVERGYKPETTIASLEKSGMCIFYNPCGDGISSDMR